MIAGTAPYPRNQWYVAASQDELKDGPLHRWLLDKPVVLFRTASGEPVALFDRCPHRGLPLSLGKVVQDTIQCTYHGIRFNEKGDCVDIPSGGPISPRMCVESFPLALRWEWLWIWMGDPALADESLIPDLRPFGFGQAEWHCEVGPLLPVAANYLLPFENLLDASHISFLHHGLIDSGDVASMPFETKVEGDWMRVIRKIDNEQVSPLTQATFATSATTADRTIIADAHAPNLCGVRVDLEFADGREAGVRVNQLMIAITPVTSTSCIQHTAICQNFPFVNQNREQDVRDLLMEDVHAMESIQSLVNSLDAHSHMEVSVHADAPAMRMRKKIQCMVEAESAG